MLNFLKQKRRTVPEEIAHAVIFAIENTFMTGTEIVVDGGMLAQLTPNINRELRED